MKSQINYRKNNRTEGYKTKNIQHAYHQKDGQDDKSFYLKSSDLEDKEWEDKGHTAARVSRVLLYKST